MYTTGEQKLYFAVEFFSDLARCRSSQKQKGNFKKHGNSLIKITKELISNTFLNEKYVILHSRI